eukprot:Clim_evm32s199 gene=Clim_evmTU32s199
MSRRGALIVLEGLDRSGKTSQVARLIENLKRAGTKTEGKRFPDRTTPTGKIINDYLAQGKDLDDHCIHLLFSANRWEAASEIKAKLLSGTTVVVDRYVWSGIAYTAAKGLPIDWCKSCDYGLPNPDAVFFLELSMEEASKRGEYGAERYEKEEFQKKVREVFYQVKKPEWISIDAARTVDEVADDIIVQAKEVVKKAENRPISVIESL